jgi:hypothetical protein
MKCTEILILKIRLALPIIAPDEGKSFAVAELQQSPLPAWRNDAVGPNLFDGLVGSGSFRHGLTAVDPAQGRQGFQAHLPVHQGAVIEPN